ncbi:MULTISPECIES: hypothetical protein [unclassified Brevundimonas]|uniref:hypothetical protein n=1 Tax=unclassified Brevundimonas TaxID=2622653 RepID=UPI0025BD8D5E|nr:MULTISPECIES: hypothetical protein [unclassified Brevundimonas]
MTDIHPPASRPSVLDRFPGGEQVVPRRTPQARALASLAAAAWPPIILTLFVWPPHNWFSGLDTDWRIVLLIVGLVAAPLGLLRLEKARRPNDAPWTRRAVVARFVIYGGLLAAVLQVAIALVLAVTYGLAGQSFIQALGSVETVLLIFGVAGVPVALMVGISYALWGGLCMAFIAYQKAPAKIRRPF